MPFKYSHLFGSLFVMFALAAFVGCQRTDNSRADGHSSEHGDDHENADHDAGHEHEPGAHGGTIVAIGEDNYHAEAVFQADGKLRLYMLGRDETRVQEVDVQELTAHAKPAGGQAVQFTLVADPQEGDAQGKTSSFMGEIPPELRGKALEVTIPNLRVADERFRLRFSTEAPDGESHHEESIPAKVTNEAEQTLYLTPGGIYTLQDIAANGHQTASQKFAGFDSQHDLKPQPGDRICPVTLTKANEKCSWIIAGKEYQFCCPPCVDEFIALAKTEPNEIKAPDEYVKN